MSFELDMNPKQDACSGLGTRDARTSATPDLPAQLPPSIPTRFIQNLSEVEYPEGIKGPKVELNANVANGRFRYDRDFLMQFMHICKEKPPTLPPLDVLGIAPIDQSSFAMVRDGHGRHRNPSTVMAPTANCQASMGIFQSTGSKLTSEEHSALSSAWSYAIGNGNGSNRTRSKRGGAKRGGSNKATLSKQGQGSTFESSCIVPLGTDLEPVVPIEKFANNLTTPSTTREGQLEVDSPEVAEREIKALLDKLTMDGFDSISDQIIEWANKSVDEKDGRTLIQVIRLVFEKAADEAACSEMYARLCRKMMEQINPDVQDGEIKDQQGEPISGGQLFRRHLIERCREDFER
ncbi:ARM repeat-containing protein, partial [Rhizopogon salebrosus TDB-379]